MILADALTLAYAVGLLGVLFEWVAYAQRQDSAFKNYSALAALLWSLMYWLMSAWTAALTMMLTALRTLLSNIPSLATHRHSLSVGFVLVFMLITWLTWQGWVSLLPAFAVINTTLALFYLTEQSMRIMLLASSAAWIINDIYWQAWPALFAESVAMMINMHSLWQYTKMEKEELNATTR